MYVCPDYGEFGRNELAENLRRCGKSDLARLSFQHK